MNHYVYLGKLTLYGAEAVDVALARPVTVYNGIGSGEFPVPEDQKLREWTVKGQWTEQNDYHLTGWMPAHKLLKSIQAMMESSEPEQLIIHNGVSNISKRVYITDVDMAEKYAGVYSFTLKATEYKKTTVRTTGVPAITRPGKIPEMPKTVVFDSAGAVATDAVKRTIAMNAVAGALSHQAGTDTRAISSAMVTGGLTYRWIDRNGNMQTTTNPNIAPLGTPVDVIDTTVNAVERAKSQIEGLGISSAEDVKREIERLRAKQANKAMQMAIEEYKRMKGLK